MPEESLRETIQRLAHNCPIEHDILREPCKSVDALLTLIHSEKVKAGEKVAGFLDAEVKNIAKADEWDEGFAAAADSAHRAVEEIKKNDV